MFYLSNRETRIYNFDVPSPFHVMIVHDLTRCYFDTFYCHDDYGTFHFMFGVPDDHIDFDNVLDLLERNVFDYIDNFEVY